MIINLHPSGFGHNFLLFHGVLQFSCLKAQLSTLLEISENKPKKCQRPKYAREEIPKLVEI
ncbi:hypothetical protein OH686_19275 [Pseudomonas sp. SO81]|nr:hypothetical protein OH686_19275 [Pseudomonas sp. SO81]